MHESPADWTRSRIVGMTDGSATASWRSASAKLLPFGVTEKYKNKKHSAADLEKFQSRKI